MQQLEEIEITLDLVLMSWTKKATTSFLPTALACEEGHGSNNRKWFYFMDS